jgi:predicted ATPase
MAEAAAAAAAAAADPAGLLSSSSGQCFVAVVENRAKEVGFAVLDMSQMALSLLQYIENGSSYTNTHMLLETHQPEVVLIVAGSQQQVQASGVNAATKQHKQVRPWCCV